MAIVTPVPLFLQSGRDRSSRSEVFLVKGVLKIYSKFTGEHPCRSAISITLQSKISQNSLENTCAIEKKAIWHMCFPVNNTKLLGTTFIEHCRWLLLNIVKTYLLSEIKSLLFLTLKISNTKRLMRCKTLIIQIFVSNMFLLSKRKVKFKY